MFKYILALITALIVCYHNAHAGNIEIKHSYWTNKVWDKHEGRWFYYNPYTRGWHVYVKGWGYIQTTHRPSVYIIDSQQSKELVTPASPLGWW